MTPSSESRALTQMKSTSFAAAPSPSALSAFRSDLPVGGRPTTRDDDRLLTIALLMRHASSAPTATAARRSLARARRVARDVLTPRELKDGPYFDEPGPPSPVRVFRMVVDRAIRTGQVALANHMLDSLAGMVKPDTLEAGRLLSNRAATSWYGGYRELSLVQYRQLTRLGRRLREPELLARGLHGMMLATWSAGNLPGAVRLARQAIRAAGTKCPRVASTSTLALAVNAAVKGDFDSALTFAWRSYKLAGQHGQRENALINITQILVDAGYPGAAQVAAKHLLRHRSFIAAPAVLGAYALASAALGDVAAVEWAVGQALDAAKSPAFQRENADSLLECSFALEQIGRPGRATQIRAKAQALATRHGYHDIAYLAEKGIRRGSPRAPSRITKASEAIVMEIGSLESENPALVELHAG